MTSPGLRSGIGCAVSVTSIYNADVITVVCDWLSVQRAKDRSTADWTTMTSFPTGSQNVCRRPCLFVPAFDPTPLNCLPAKFGRLSTIAAE